MSIIPKKSAVDVPTNATAGDLILCIRQAAGTKVPFVESKTKYRSLAIVCPMDINFGGADEAAIWGIPLTDEPPYELYFRFTPQFDSGLELLGLMADRQTSRTIRILVWEVGVDTHRHTPAAVMFSMSRELGKRLCQVLTERGFTASIDNVRV